MSRRFASAAAAALLAAGCGRAPVRPDAPVALRYGAREGDARRWALAQVFRGKIAMGGLPQLVVIALKGEAEETCERALPGGSARLRVRWSFEPPEMDGLAAPGLERTRTETRVVRSPAGELTDEGGGAAPADAVAWASRALGGLTPVLPDAPVRAGEGWTRALALPVAGGTLKGTARGTFEGWDGAEPPGRFALVADRGEAALDGAPRGGPLEAFSLKWTGTARFDPAAGALVSAERSGELHLKARDGKARVEALFRFTASVRPLP